MKRVRDRHIHLQQIAEVCNYIIAACLYVYELRLPPGLVAQPSSHKNKHTRFVYQHVSTIEAFKPFRELTYKFTHLMFGPEMSINILVLLFTFTRISNLRVQQLVPFRAYCGYHNVVPA